MCSTARVTSKTTVVRRSQPHDVYVGRPSKWGNPYHIGKDGTRAQVIQKYREYLLSSPHLLAKLHTPKGLRLGCYCAPLACHGDVLAELADAIPLATDPITQANGLQD
jgi:hypothetical protein